VLAFLEADAQRETGQTGVYQLVRKRSGNLIVFIAGHSFAGTGSYSFGGNGCWWWTGGLCVSIKNKPLFALVGSDADAE
jgi:hypothetical protein